MSGKGATAMESSGSVGMPHHVNTFIDFWLGQQLRSLRKERSLSLQELASRSGISVGTISQVERGLTSASVKTLSRLASGLDVSLNSLLSNVETQREEFHGWVARAADHRALLMTDKKIIKEVITPPRCQSLDLYRVRIKPGGSTGNDLFVTEALEIAGTVVSGSLELWIGKESTVLQEGDSFCYPGQAPRRWSNPGPQENYIIWAITRK